MKKYALLLSFFLVVSSVFSQVTCKRDTVLMGSRFDITISDVDAVSAERNINLVIDEIVRIEQLISDWKTDSQVSEINRNAGIQPVKVDSELFELIKRALFFLKLLVELLISALLQWIGFGNLMVL